MTTTTTAAPPRREPELLGHPVVAIGGSAVHVMIDTTLTGATYDVDGRQQLVAG